MDFLGYPDIIQKFIDKFASDEDGQGNSKKEESYHTQKIIIGEQNIDYNTNIQIKFKVNCANNKFAIVNERCLFIQFKYKESLTPDQIKEQYTNFTKLVKQIVTVASMLNKEMREFFKAFKPECIQGKSSFNLYVKLPQEYQAYWVTFQDYLLSYFAKITKEELVLIKIQSDVCLSDIIPKERPANLFFSILKNCKIEIYSFLNKLINEETKSVIQELSSDNALEKQYNDLLMLLYNLTKSQVDINMDSFTSDELEQLGLFPFSIDPITLDFQPAIISKIRNFFRDTFCGNLKINFLNSQTMCQIKLDTKDDISQIIDILVKTDTSNNQ